MIRHICFSLGFGGVIYLWVLADRWVRARVELWYAGKAPTVQRWCDEVANWLEERAKG